ncbi:MAG TPA: hypothetical protein PLJ34_01325 [Hyphomicrobiales bacterium]|nr:hypothetical protein [Hyphomicrobiales bacterium]
MRPERLIGAIALMSLAFTVLFWAVMYFGTLPYIRADAGGLEPLELRLGGYTADEARAFLVALGAEGRAFYRGVQLVVDAIFPLIYASTLSLIAFLLTIGRLTCRRIPARLCQWGPVVIAFAAMLLDYRENFLVIEMLDMAPEAVGDDLAGMASLMTQLKASLLAVLLVVLGVLGLRAAMIWKARAEA